jgi:hypothetical protein
MPTLVPQDNPTVDAGVSVDFQLPVPVQSMVVASPVMESFVVRKSKVFRKSKFTKFRYDPKAHVGCHAQKSRLYKTWPI